MRKVTNASSRPGSIYFVFYTYEKSDVPALRNVCF